MRLVILIELWWWTDVACEMVVINGNYIIFIKKFSIFSLSFSFCLIKQNFVCSFRHFHYSTAVGASFFIIKAFNNLLCACFVLEKCLLWKFWSAFSSVFLHIILYWLSFFVLFGTLKWKVWTNNYRLPANSSIYFFNIRSSHNGFMESNGMNDSMNSFIYLISIDWKKKNEVKRIFFIVNITIPKPTPRFLVTWLTCSVFNNNLKCHIVLNAVKHAKQQSNICELWMQFIEKSSIRKWKIIFMIVVHTMINGH